MIEIDLGNINWQKLHQHDIQKLHDKTLMMFYEGKLNPKDRVELIIAIEREQAGVVKPLGAPVPNLQNETFDN